MTEIFIIALDGILLHVQLIYHNNSSNSYTWVDFPNGFSRLTNPKYYHHTKESQKVIDDIIDPYLNEKRTYHALLIMDMFRGQMKECMLDLLKKHNIVLVRGPVNMAHLFQLLNLTLDSYFKSYMKNKFSEGCTREIIKQLWKRCNCTAT